MCRFKLRQFAEDLKTRNFDHKHLRWRENHWKGKCAHYLQHKRREIQGLNHSLKFIVCY